MADFGLRVQAPTQPGFNVSQNLDAAQTALGLTPQERALYERHLANLWGSGGVDNPDGSRSSLYQVGFNQGGQTYNVPSVYDGQIISPDAAITRANQTGLGQFPSYPNADSAEARYQQMHGYMDKDTGAYMDVRRNPFQFYGGLF
jgi:hypothetical protein